MADLVNAPLNIAVIGGSGFIGTVLVRRLLEKSHKVSILDIAPSAAYPDIYTDVDVRDKQALTDALEGVDVIYNLAAEHRDDVSPVHKYYDVNVDGARNIVDAATAHNIKTVIFTSTVAVYGLNADPVKGATEETLPAPFNDYGHSKLQAEDVFNTWVKNEEGRTLTSLRLVATFGPRNRGNIYTLMDQVARNRFIMVGSGKNRKSIAYVENVAAFLVHVMETSKSGLNLYNYADKPDLTMNVLIRTIKNRLGKKGRGLHMPYVIGILGGTAFDVLAKLSGKKFPISAIRVKKFCANTVVNADKLEGTTFTRPYTLEQGLEHMIDAEFEK